MKPSAEIETEFRQIVQALAQPAAIQADLFSDSEAIGQAMVLRFSKSWALFKAECFSSLSPLQRGRVRELASFVKTISAEHNQEFWTGSDALKTDARWEEIRKRSRSILHAFDWKDQRPPKQEEPS